MGKKWVVVKSAMVGGGGGLKHEISIDFQEHVDFHIAL